ncbi:MAG: glycosyltransferase family 4 protein [Pirellulaceae bacterium]
MSARASPLAVVLPSLAGGGAERVGVELANIWARSGRAVTLLSLDDRPPTYAIDPSVTRVQLGLLRVSRHVVAAMRNNIWRVRRLRRALRATGAQQVVSLSDVTNVTTLLAGWGQGWDIVVCERTEPRHHAISRIWNRLRRALYGHARALVVQTESVAGWARQQGWRIPIYVIPNAAPDLSFIAPPAPQVTRGTMLAVGRLSREKGMDVLLDAFARLAGDHPGWQLQVFGEGVERTKLEDAITAYQLAGRVHLPGWTADLPARFGAADIFALPSRYEGFPNALLEAMAAGLPCVACDCDSGPREIIRPGLDGLLVPPEDPRSLAEALDRLIRDVGLRQTLSTRAREVTRRFSQSDFQTRWQAVLAGSPP